MTAPCTYAWCIGGRHEECPGTWHTYPGPCSCDCHEPAEDERPRLRVFPTPRVTGGAVIGGDIVTVMRVCDVCGWEGLAMVDESRCGRVLYAPMSGEISVPIATCGGVLRAPW